MVMRPRPRPQSMVNNASRRRLVTYTVWGGNLFKRFCEINNFPSFLTCMAALQYSPIAWETRRKHFTKPLGEKLAPQTVFAKWFGKSELDRPPICTSRTAICLQIPAGISRAVILVGDHAYI